MKVLTLTILLSVACSTLADVFLPFDHSKIDSLTSLLENSVIPGGQREITINGSAMIVKRHISSRQSIERLARVHRTQFPSDNWSLDQQEYIKRYQALDAAAVEDMTVEGLTALAEQQLAIEKTRILEDLETPMNFKAGQWDVFAMVPVSAIAPDNPLARVPVSEGYLYLAEQAGDPAGVWEIRFKDGFSLLHVFGGHEGDAPGFDPAGVTRYPGAKRTLTYSEEANNWHATSWSYQSRGNVAHHIAHYEQEFSQQGYIKAAIDYSSRNERLLQMAKGRKRIVIHIMDHGKGSEPIQITIQKSMAT